MTKSFRFMIWASLAAIPFFTGTSSVQAQTPAALTGKVSSAEEGSMEGVLVSAKRAGSTVTITVVSDRQGRYSFPRTKLEPGRYALRIRAVGYQMDDPGPAEIAAQKTTQRDLKLRKTQDLSTQLSNGEWMISWPGTDDQKKAFLGCTGCHTLDRIVRSKHTAAQWPQIFQRMTGYAPGSTAARPQVRTARREEGEANSERAQKQAEYASSINLSAASRWEYPLKTLPRPKGRATRVIVTEYDLPRPESMPHDVVMDSEGMLWYSDFGWQYLGKLNPKTAQVVEYPVPELKQGFPTGLLDVEFDHEGNIWLGMMLQAGIAKFDKKTEKFQTWPLPKGINSDVGQQAMVMPIRNNVDGKVWMNNVGLRGLHRVDLKTGDFETFEPYKDLPRESGPHSAYGISADSQNNIYFMDFANRNVGKIEAKTGKITLFPTPTPNSTPRRGHMDSQDRLWFTEFQANKVAMFDTRAEKFQEWALPTAWTGPYDVMWDKNGELWTSGMSNDLVVRMNIKTGESTEYLLPRNTNVRRVDVDNSTTPVTFWVGNNHGGSITKVEPLD